MQAESWKGLCICMIYGQRIWFDLDQCAMCHCWQCAIEKLCYQPVGLRSRSHLISKLLNGECRYVSLRSKNGAGRTDRRCDATESGACARHDSAATLVGRKVAGVEPAVRGVSEIFWRSAEAGERNIEAVGGIVWLPAAIIFL